jgi:hypothetical protein
MPLRTLTTNQPSATGVRPESTSSRGASSTMEVRQDLLAEELELSVPLLAPQLEHDVRAAGVAVGLDRGDAVGGRARDRPAAVEQRVGDLSLGGEPAARSIASAKSSTACTAASSGSRRSPSLTSRRGSGSFTTSSWPSFRDVSRGSGHSRSRPPPKPAATPTTSSSALGREWDCVG